MLSSEDTPLGVRLYLGGMCLVALGVALLAQSLRDAERDRKRLRDAHYEALQDKDKAEKNLDGALATISDLKRADAGSL